MKTRKTSNRKIKHALEFTRLDPSERHRIAGKMILIGRITDAMQSTGMTKVELARAMGVDVSTVYKWITGKNNLSMDTILDIEHVLRTKILFR